ncbi:MAG: HAMP domain-containing histidine kinase [Rhodobacteraceae bacterium]|nr:HAMP domain-containing histidine kinase [Paracoccaceae bacterium]
MNALRARASLRLAALIAGAVMVPSLAGLGIFYLRASEALHANQVALVEADLRGLAAIYDQRRIIALRQAIEFRAAANPAGGEAFILLAEDGTRLAGTLAAWPEGLPALEGAIAGPRIDRFAVDGAAYLGAARILPGGFALLVARPLASVEATLAGLRGLIVAVAAAMLAAGGALGWMAGRSVLGRIERVNALADRVAAGELDARLPGPRSRDEFGLLETHVHAMLDRIQNLNRATHHLSDSIAHELRTPLNRMAQRLARLHAPAPEVEALRSEMRGTIRIFDSLLAISRAEADAGQGPGLVPVDLSAVAAEVWELYEPVAEDKGLVPEAAIDPGLAVLGDRTLIAQALSNLIENAVKYCAAGDRLRLTLRAAGERQVLTVEDSGPGLPDDVREAAFDRFTRGARDRELPGHGLGLALVRAIAARHGARLSLPPRERGLAIEIAFPRLG